MSLSNENIAVFQTIYLKRFGKEISKEEALKKGLQVLRLMELVYKPMTREEYKKIQQRRKESGNL